MGTALDVFRGKGSLSAAAVNAGNSFQGSMDIAEQERLQYKNKAIEGDSASTAASQSALAGRQSANDAADGMEDDATQRIAGSAVDMGTVVGTTVGEGVRAKSDVVTDNSAAKKQAETNRSQINDGKAGFIQGSVSPDAAAAAAKKSVGLDAQAQAGVEVKAENAKASAAERAKDPATLNAAIEKVRQWDVMTAPDGGTTEALETIKAAKNNPEVVKVLDEKKAEIKQGIKSAEKMLDSHHSETQRWSQKGTSVGQAVNQTLQANGQLMNSEAQHKKADQDFNKTWADFVERLFSTNMKTADDVAQTLHQAAASFQDTQSNLIRANAN